MDAWRCTVRSRANLDLLKSLGANRVIDYTEEDSPGPGAHFDFMLDAVGKMKTSKLKVACGKALAPEAVYAPIDDGSLLLDSRRLDRMRELVEAGHIRPVVDKCYPFEEIVKTTSTWERGTSGATWRSLWATSTAESGTSRTKEGVATSVPPPTSSGLLLHQTPI